MKIAKIILILFFIKKVVVVNWDRYKTYTSLELNRKQIVSIQGIEKLIKLTSLDLS
jgi:Leucine-rich repeat (LRR) protein